MSRSALVCCLVASLAAAAASQALKSPPDFSIKNSGAKTTIKIGCLLPFTGENRVKGVAAHNGIKVALTDLAKKFPAYNFQLICEDTQCKADAAKNAALALKKAGVVGVIGDVCSTASLAAKDVLAPVLLISPSSTSDKLTAAGDNFIRTVAPDRYQSLVLANLVKGTSPVPVGVAFEPNAYGLGLADGFEAAYKKLGGSVKTRVQATTTNAVQAAADLAKTGVKRIVIASNNNTWVAQFLAAGAAIPGFTPEVFAGDSQVDPELPAKVASFGKTTLLDKLTATVYNQGTPAFREQYAKATTDAYTGHAAHVYDATVVLVQAYAADAQGGKPVVSVSAVSPLKTTFTGVSGVVKFDAAGDLAPDNTSYQSVTYKAGKPVLGAALPLPAN